MSKAVQKKETSSVIPYDYGEDAGVGYEGQTGQDLLLPFVGVLQALSPQVTKKPEDGGIPGAKPGMLYNTVTGELWDGEKGLTFIPSLTEHVFVEWVPRKQGGGFVGIHDPSSEIVARAKAAAGKSFGRLSTEYRDGKPAGNDLVETFYVYGVLDLPEGPEPAVIAFTSTKIAPYKKWSTRIHKFRRGVPLFAHQVHITTTHQRNSEGEFFNVRLQPAVNNSVAESLLPPDSELLKAAKEMGQMVNDGLARAAVETQDSGATSTGAAADESEPPF